MVPRLSSRCKQRRGYGPRDCSRDGASRLVDVCFAQDRTTSHSLRQVPSRKRACQRTFRVGEGKRSTAVEGLRTNGRRLYISFDGQIFRRSSRHYIRPLHLSFNGGKVVHADVLVGLGERVCEPRLWCCLALHCRSEDCNRNDQREVV